MGVSSEHWFNIESDLVWINSITSLSHISVGACTEERRSLVVLCAQPHSHYMLIEQSILNKERLHLTGDAYSYPSATDALLIPELGPVGEGFNLTHTKVP